VCIIFVCTFGIHLKFKTVIQLFSLLRSSFSFFYLHIFVVNRNMHLCCNRVDSCVRREVCAFVLVIKTNEMHCFSNLFWYRTLHVSDRLTVHHQESSTVYTAIGICHTGYADCLLARSGWNIHISLADSQHNLYDKYLLLRIQY